jgi:hypothetical protein
MKKYKIHWLSGKPEVVEGHDVADACRRAGIEVGAVRAIDRYEEVHDPQVSGAIQVHVTKATVVQYNGLDECSLNTDLVGTMWPEGTKVSFKFTQQFDTGAQWILDHFGLVAEVITVPSRMNPA